VLFVTPSWRMVLSRELNMQTSRLSSAKHLDMPILGVAIYTLPDPLVAISSSLSFCFLLQIRKFQTSSHPIPLCFGFISPAITNLGSAMVAVVRRAVSERGTGKPQLCVEIFVTLCSSTISFFHPGVFFFPSLFGFLFFAHESPIKLAFPVNLGFRLKIVTN